MKKKIVRKDESSRVVLKSVVVGHFAMWAVRQSPYLFPEELGKGIAEFDKTLHSNIEAGIETLIATTYKELKENIENTIANSKIISSWNVPKKGSGGPVFVSAYSCPKQDYDIVDLDALARNIAQSVWLELIYDDEGLNHE
jgi:hypothetical protein